MRDPCAKFLETAWLSHSFRRQHHQKRSKAETEISPHESPQRPQIFARYPANFSRKEPQRTVGQRRRNSFHQPAPDPLQYAMGQRCLISDCCNRATATPPRRARQLALSTKT